MYQPWIFLWLTIMRCHHSSRGVVHEIGLELNGHVEIPRRDPVLVELGLELLVRSRHADAAPLVDRVDASGRVGLGEWSEPPVVRPNLRVKQ